MVTMTDFRVVLGGEARSEQENRKSTRMKKTQCHVRPRHTQTPWVETGYLNATGELRET